MSTTIRYRIYSAELAPFAAEGETCESFADRYATNLAAKLRSEWPEVEVEIEIKHNVTGAGSGYQGVGDDPPWCWEVAEIAEAVLSRQSAAKTAPMHVHKRVVIDRLREHPAEVSVYMPGFANAEDAITALRSHPGDWIVDGLLLTPEEYAQLSAADGGAS